MDKIKSQNRFFLFTSLLKLMGFQRTSAPLLSNLPLVETHGTKISNDAIAYALNEFEHYFPILIINISNF